MIFEKRTKQRERLYRTRQTSDKEKPETHPLDHNHTHFLMLQDEFGEEDNRREKPENRYALRTDLILNLRAQIEEESRKITSQGQSKRLKVANMIL